MKAPIPSLLIAASFFIQCNSGVVSHNNISYSNDTNIPTPLSGGNYASILRVPYQAQLCRGYLVHCGAVIISMNWLITAAHCFENRNISELKVVTGTQYSCGSSGMQHTIDTAIVHSEYDSKTLTNDICLIKLQKSIELSSHQQPVKIAKKGPRPGVMMLISGYGYEEVNQGQAPSLKIARVRVLQPSKCRALYEKSGDKVADTAFCAGGGVETACFGDSGGPGVVGGRLAGIVSAGRDCGSPNFPSLFTRVALFHEWIEEHTDVRIH